MKRYKIKFLNEDNNQDNSFIKNNDNYLTTAYINETIEGSIETFHVKLIDIGLNSYFGEFYIVKSNGFWQSSDQDSKELNQLKKNIIAALIIK